VDLAVQQSDDPLAGESSTRHGSAQRLATVPLRAKRSSDAAIFLADGASVGAVQRAPQPRLRC
jgi:hypothetical protein